MSLLALCPILQEKIVDTKKTLSLFDPKSL